MHKPPISPRALTSVRREADSTARTRTLPPRPPPRNRRNPAKAGPSRWVRLWATLKRLGGRIIPTRLRLGVSWSLDQRSGLRSVGVAIVTGWAVLTIIGFVRAWSLDGTYHDRAEELAQLQHQLGEARSQTALLESQLQAIDRRAEVRMTVIRQELGMVRPNERVVRFRGD